MSKFTCELGEVKTLKYRHLPAKRGSLPRVMITFTHTFDVKSRAFGKSIKALGGRYCLNGQEVMVTFAVRSAKDAKLTVDKAMTRFYEQMGWCANPLKRATKHQKRRVLEPLMRPIGTRAS